MRILTCRSGSIIHSRFPVGYINFYTSYYKNFQLTITVNQFYFDLIHTQRIFQHEIPDACPA